MSDKKPLIFYIDDEPNNLTVFEAGLPSEWEIRTFSNPLQALEALNQVSPAVVVSDQRMPGFTGVQLLELVKKVAPHAVRIIVTGYSDEDLVIESVRRAQVYDYLRKPWDADELEKSIRRAIELHDATVANEKLTLELQARQKELDQKHQLLVDKTIRLEKSNEVEQGLRQELECWVPPFVRWALEEKTIQFPLKRDLVGITFDIIKSHEILGVLVDGKPLRSLAIHAFSEAIIRGGGWRESHAGDSAYGHFGLLEQKIDPYDAALSVAREFWGALRVISVKACVDLNCGIALHRCRDSYVDIHRVEIQTPREKVTQKSFDTTSGDIDLLHRMEKLVHPLRGTNIIFSEEFLNGVRGGIKNAVELGPVQLVGRKKPIQLYLLPDEGLTSQEIETFKKGLPRISPSNDVENTEEKKAA